MKFRDRIKKLEPDIKTIEIQEEEEKELRATENQMNKMERIVKAKKEDESTIKRVWFQSHKERKQEKGRI